MTVIGIQQTNRRMCRYVFVMFIFLCWPQDVYVQGLPSVSCEAGKVTVGEEATITCIFPPGSIKPGNSNFVVKKFTASNPRDGTDIMDCFHVFGSTSGDPKCIFPDKSLGYNFTFESENDRQTVVIHPAKQSDAGEYGCDRINHMVVRCNLTVKEMTTTTPVTTTTTDSKTTSTKKEDRTPTPDPDPGLSPGAIVGIVIGILVAVVLLGGAAYIVWRRKCRKPTPITFDKVLTLAMLKEKYPQKAWIQAYTDGSTTYAVQNGRAVVYIKYPNGRLQKETVPTGLHGTNDRADVEALVHAANTLSGTAYTDAQIVFLTDATSVFEAAAANKLPRLQDTLQNIKCTRLVLQWIPSHCGIYGSEEADRMADAEEEQDENEMKPMIKRPQDSCHQLSKQEQVTIFHLRTRHNRLIFHMPVCFHLEPSPKCPCGEAEQTIEHILQDCGNHQPLRKVQWPQPATLQEKLFGPVEALQKTTNFIARANLQV